MKTLFFSLGTTSERYPPALVLELKEYLQRLQMILTDLEDEQYSLKWVLETALSCIQYEREALFQLSAETSWVEYEHFETSKPEQYKALCELTYSVGEYLFKTLKELGAYRKGYLPYQYHGTLRTALILLHLDYSEGEPQ